MNKFSCADFTFPLLEHNKVLQLIKLLGINAVDIGVFEGRSHHYPSHISKNPTQEGQKLYSQLQKYNLEAADVFLQTGEEPSIAAANTPDINIRENNRNAFLNILEFAKNIGAKHVTGLPGVYHSSETNINDWKRACEEASWRVHKAKDQGIVYAVEPHVGSILSDTASTLQFIKDCPDITLTLDYGHFIYQGESNESVHPLIDFATHFHARGGARGKLQSLFKDNEIDFESIISKMNEIDYSGFLCLEYVHVDWEGCNRTDNVSETIRLYEMLKSLIN